MKRRDLENKLVELGWWFSRHGGSHDIWTNGAEVEPIPRHSEINEYISKKIIKKAKSNPPAKGN
jgi:mRNA interferase HicA